MIIACGIDPAARYGIAIVEYPGDKIIGRYSGGNRAQGGFLLHAYGDTGAILAIEDQFISDSPKMSTKERRGRQASAVKVAHRAGEWAGMARAYGWPQAIYVKPQSWRGAYKRTGRVKGSKRWSKGDAVQWANTLFRLSLEPAEHDLAEALLIARWAAVRAVQDMRIKG
ncbi:MAG: hypothetical protein V3V34_11640 [Kiloniellales bacterium]